METPADGQDREHGGYRSEGSSEHPCGAACTCFSHNGFLTRKGYLLREALAGRRSAEYVDKVSSVSALVEVEDDPDYDAGHTELNRRLVLHGS